MTGRKETAATLDATLERICRLLNETGIRDWFVCYGTLLGLVRDGGCIEGDDDIDIIVSQAHLYVLRDMLERNGFELDGSINDKGLILKTRASEGSASVDIYMARMEAGSVHDLWNRLEIRNPYSDEELRGFPSVLWRGLRVNVPADRERVLRNRYGSGWTERSGEKVPQTMNVL